MKLFSILGNSQKLDGGAMFGNAPRALWSRWLEPDEHNRVPLCCRALLATELNGLNVLFEAGIGAFFDPSMRERYGVVESHHVLLDSLRDRGLSDADIDVVVLSHLHFDHAGGLLAAWDEGVDPELLFPNARFLVGAEAFERARRPHARDRASFIPGLLELLEASGRLEIVTGERCDLLGDAVRFRRSDGHTPGMLISEIGGDGGYVYCADLIPGAPWVHVPITMGYDRYPEALIDEKRALLEDAAARGMKLFFTHDASVAASEVGQDERGRYLAKEPMAVLDGEALVG